MTSEPPLTLTFVLFPGFSNMVLANAVEPFRAACDMSGRPLFDWRIATIDGAPVKSSSELWIQAEAALAEVPPGDALVLVAGYGAREEAARRAVRTAVRQAARKASFVVGLDMGAWILAAAGLLQGRRATVHWHEVDAFAEEFLDVDVVAENFVIDGDRLSAGSATSAMALILDMIRDTAGDALAYDVSTLFIYDDAERRRADSGALSPQLGRAVRTMLKTIEEPLPLSEIADQAGVSLRTLDRMFERELGVSAGAYYRSVRLSHAQSLATATDMKAKAIATRTGFASSATLSRAYKAHFGQTMSAARRRARG
ncbi:GlxA family transcriptional regulator [Pseudooceanicola sp. LIPI14-2-Ac024]|uniref:GlxA family transcriptional regulator n=1 Tax=Pseudooceanicola sp. LIPI14-2-Ac024 TaxID=3344875 RepID=UPI0035D0A094